MNKRYEVEKGYRAKFERYIRLAKRIIGLAGSKKESLFFDSDWGKYLTSVIFGRPLSLNEYRKMQGKPPVEKKFLNFDDIQKIKEMIKKGWTNKEIAKDLNFTTRQIMEVRQGRYSDEKFGWEE